MHSRELLRLQSSAANHGTFRQSGRHAGDLQGLQLRKKHCREGSFVMENGTMKWFNQTKGFGFIEPEDGSKDAFVHISAVQQSGLAALTEGQKVSYELIEGREGKMAAQNLEVIE
jgi:CspA family cold shock protein